MSDTLKRILINTESGRKFSYAHGQDVFFVDGEPTQLRNPRQKIVLWRLLDARETCLTYEEIHRLLKLTSDVEPQRFAHRFINSLNGLFARNRGLDKTFISNVRGQGYLLNSVWKLQSAPTQAIQAHEFIETLEQIVKSCVAHSAECELVHRPNGIQYLRFDSNLALQKFSMLDKLLWDLVGMLSAKASYAQLTNLKDEFQELSTYILFWRLGDSLTEMKWKSDYAIEIQARADNIRRQLESMTDFKAPPPA